MQQVTELLKAAGEFLAGLGAVIAPIATVVIALHRKPEPRRPPRRRRRRGGKGLPNIPTIRKARLPSYRMGHHERQTGIMLAGHGARRVRRRAVRTLDTGRRAGAVRRDARIPGGEAERMTFADMLDERGIRQSQIARAAGLTRQRVNEWVRGVRDPRLMALGTARRVADALEMTIDEFESRL